MKCYSGYERIDDIYIYSLIFMIEKVYIKEIVKFQDSAGKREKYEKGNILRNNANFLVLS